MNSVHDIPGSHRHQVSVIAHAAATATENIPIWEVPFDCVITDIKIIPATDITGQDTNTTHVNFDDRAADGSGSTEIDNFDFVSGTDATSGDALSGATTDVNIDADDVLALQYEKVGTGLAIPALLVVIDYKAR